MNTHFKALKKTSHRNGPQDKDIPAETKEYAPKNLTAEDLPSIPVYFETWVKYFNFAKNSEDPQRKSKPKFFFKNGSFQTQQTTNQETQKDDQVFFFLK